MFTTIQSINYLGLDYYLRERKSGLFWTVVFVGFIIYRIYHLRTVFSIQAEVFAKGFYLKHGSKEYAYEFKDIIHLQKAFFRGGNNQINSVLLVLHLASGEQIKINET
ncbi:MAG: hypothetical protein LBD11_05540 [Candidatus Peribacteria bacterium]|nr:hypothetical protein [Candidatus Peribacteria bacterium]